jgi:hypothetical protein
MNIYLKYLTVLLLCVVFNGLTAQNRIEPFEPVIMLKESEFSRSFDGYQPQVIQKQHGSTSFTGTKPNFTFHYTPDSGYVGVDTVIVQFQDSEDWFRHNLFYLSFVFDVVQSRVIANHDYYTIQVNDTNAIFSVVSNDSTSAGALTLTSLPLVNNGTASIQNDDIVFTPNTDYEGMAYINYVVCDSLGVCDAGAVTVCVLDSNQFIISDTMNVVTKEDLAVEQPLPATSYVIGDSAKNGVINFLASDLVSYVPDAGYFGLDSFKLDNTNNSSHRFFRIQVLERKDNRSTLVDDVAFTVINKPVFIDVQANDVSDNFDVKTKRQPGLGTLLYIDSLKQYKYIPPLDIESIESFDYGLKGGRITEEATATIYINDGHPDSNTVYQLTTPINEPLVLNYSIPVDDHDFSIKTAPPIGTVDIYNSDTSVVVECDTITGNHFIVFKPGYNYVGPHVFTLEHCVRGTSFCRDIDIVVTTTNDPQTGCYCVDDCVWAGDVNYDGRVNMKDLLPLAHHLGQAGGTRSNGSTNWNAQTAPMWDQTLAGQAIDLKHADTDGDGQLTVSDTSAISDNYFKEHSMVPELVGPSRQYAFYLVPRFDTVLAGELAVVDIVFGASDHPIEDMEGVAYTLNFSPHVKYDSSTVQVAHSPASFLTFNSPYIGMAKQPWYRRIDVGISRTNGTTSNGYGIVSTVSFIVEEDLAGIKSKNGIRPFKFSLDQAVGMSGNGQTYDLPESEVTLYLNMGQPKVPFSADRLTVWPNPNQGVFNVHLNGEEEMLSASLWSVDGRPVMNWPNIDPDHQRLVMDEYLSGMFILRVETTAGVVTKKIQVLNR